MNAADQLQLAPAEPRHAVNHAGWAIEYQPIDNRQAWWPFRLRYATKAEADTELAASPKVDGLAYRVYEQVKERASV